MLYKAHPESLHNFDAISGYSNFGFGFAADTNLGTKKTFNYRFRLGYDFQRSGHETANNLHRIAMTHIFGAGLYQSNFLRIWLGPQLGFGYLWGPRIHKYNFVYLEKIPGGSIAIFYDPYIFRDAIKFNFLNLNIGMTLGLNINIDRNVCIPIEGGFRFQFYTNLKRPFSRGLQAVFNVMEPEGYGSIGAMYRFNEPLSTSN